MINSLTGRIANQPNKEDGMIPKQKNTWFLIRMIEDDSNLISEIFAAAVMLYVLQKLAAVKEIR